MRPPGMNRPTMIRYPPRLSTCSLAQLMRSFLRSVAKKRRTIHGPARRPIQYEMLSPTIAPPAANRITAKMLRSPVPASTPARMTDVSLGTSGMRTSRAETPKRYGYVQTESETYSLNDSNT